MNKVLRYEDVNPDDVTALGLINIEYVDKNYRDFPSSHGCLLIPASEKTYIKQVELFIEKVNSDNGISTYVYAGDQDGNIFVHLNGYVGLWIKTDM